MAKQKLGFNSTWSMAVGGMVGGGIFSTLGVVVGISGALAWLSFLIAGLIALAAGYSYVKLADRYKEGGGSFAFLREIGADGAAGSLAWILIVGYILTNAVYAFTFGQYLGHVVGLGAWFPRVAAVAILALFVGVNLRGVGEAGGLEIVLVWFKLAVLLGLAGFGLAAWSPPMLSEGIPSGNIGTALLGAASVFIAYEGFQLLTYDYDDIADPGTMLPRAVLSAIIVVIGVYIAVALGTVMLVGADRIVANQEVALAIAGRQALGTTGVIVVTVAAAFSTGSAINSTLFATARLTETVAEAGQLPASLAEDNSLGVPHRAILWLGGVAALLAAVGTLTSLVEAASLAFLATFSLVSALAWQARAGHRTITGAGAVAGAVAGAALVIRLVSTDPIALIFLGLLAGVAFFGRSRILAHVQTTTPDA